MDTTLIRDEIISASSLDLPGQQRFNMVKAAIGSSIGPDHTTRTSEIVAEARDALTEEQRTINMLHEELRRLLTQLTEARTEASQSHDVAEALQLVAEAAPNSGDEVSAEDARSMVADRRAALDSFNRARTRSAEISEQRLRVRSDAFAKQVAAVEAALRQATSLVVPSQQKLNLAQRLVETEQQYDETGAHFAALLEHGSALGLQAGHCPLCKAARTDAQFAAALETIRTGLAGQAERLEAANQALDRARTELHSNQEQIAELTGSLDGLRTERATVDAADFTIRAEYDTAGFSDVPVDDLQLAETRAAAEQQRIVSLERAALILGASTV